MKTIKEIRSTMKCHHTALHRGYVSRKCEGIVEEYHGRFGHGYIIKTPRWDTTQYYNVSYYVEKKQGGYMYTVEQWENDNSFKAKPGEQIAREIYDALLDALPPIPLHRNADYPVAVSSGFMMGEAYTHAYVNGKWRGFYSAFGKLGDACYYLGYYSISGDKLPDDWERLNFAALFEN